MTWLAQLIEHQTCKQGGPTGCILQNFLKQLWFVLFQLTSQRDYAVHIVRTPEPLEDQASDDDEPEDVEKSQKKRRKSQSKPSSLELMNEQWAATHAKQV